MTNPLLQSKAVEIDGKDYQIRLLPVAEAREIQHIIVKMVRDLDPEAAGGKYTLLASVMGQLSDTDISKLTKAFAPTTTVTLSDGRTLSLSKADAQNELWMGAPELQFEWLDACIDASFGGLIAKTKAAVLALVDLANRRAEAAAAEKAAKETKGQ